MWGLAVRSAVGVASACLVMVGCAGDGDSDDDVQRAQARVEAEQDDLADAQEAAEVAATAFCDQAVEYVTALDRYGDVLTSTKPTVGDVRDAGTDLAEPAEDVAAGAEDAVAAREDVVTAEQDLAVAKAELAEARGKSPKPTPTSTATVLVPEVPPASVDRVQQAQADLDAAVEGISDSTPLAEAAQQLNAAAVALEMSWLRLFSEAGCLTDEQQEQAAAAVMTTPQRSSSLSRSRGTSPPRWTESTARRPSTRSSPSRKPTGCRRRARSTRRPRPRWSPTWPPRAAPRRSSRSPPRRRYSRH